MINKTVEKLTNNENLSFAESKEAVNEIMSGDISSVSISSFLTALAVKGATDEEIAGAADGMRSKAMKMDCSYPVLDIVGTGGDKSNSFNISTTAALVAATAGVKIAKHGNRAASSKSGTADCLEALDVKIDVDTNTMKKALDEVGIAFLFAQKYHTAMKYVGPVRKELGFKTIFNILGPLTNPASATHMVLGVFDKDLVDVIANALVKLNIDRALVVYGNDGLDEISASAETTVAEIKDKKITKYTISPETFGFKICDKKELLGGTPEENAKITENILGGNGTEAQNIATALNAGAGIYVTSDLSLEDSVKKAMDIIKSKKGLDTLNKFVAITNGEK